MSKKKYLLIGLLLLVYGQLQIGCVPARIIAFNKPSIGDLRIFPADTIHHPDSHFSFAELPYYRPLPKMANWLPSQYASSYHSVEEFLISTKTTSFMVIRNDSILYENYFNGYFIDKPSIVFSVSKSLTTMLVGMAIADGYIQSRQQPISDFLSEYIGDKRGKITLDNLMQMTSGLKFEDKSDLIKLARAYYARDIRHFIARKVKLKHPPGTYFAYKSIDTQLLSLCLDEALKKSGSPYKNVTDYLEAKIWKPIGAEYNAYITKDRKDGVARMYGGVAACARDLAKFGRLLLNNGNWQGKQLLPEQWTAHSSTINHTQGCWWGYATGFWLNAEYITGNLGEQQDFYAAGYGGQYIYVNPEANIIIIRQGEGQHGVEWVPAMARLAGLLNNCESPDNNSVNKTSIAGQYRHNNGATIHLSEDKKGNRWLMRGGRFGGLLFPIKLVRESSHSLFNAKKRVRLILDAQGEEVVGIHFDNFHQIQYFKKEN